MTSHSIIPYKKEDPGYVHNSINLYLDMEVFNTEEGERFAMIFKVQCPPGGDPFSGWEGPMGGDFTYLYAYAMVLTK